jgi:hypothetical protein
MIANELTRSLRIARSLPMQANRTRGERSGWRAVCAATMLVGLLPAITGCISVNAPDKPIVIELNINIKQEVIYRLAADAAATIDDNPEIF